jgi:hypothetical protein
MNAINEHAWQDVTEQVRQKAKDFQGKKVRILELQAGFCEHSWCNKAHIGYVIEGAVDFEFETERRSFRVGDVFMISSAEPHKASISEKAVLFVVDL